MRTGRPVTLTAEERHTRKLASQKSAAEKLAAKEKADPALYEKRKARNRTKTQESVRRKRERLAGRPKPDSCDVCGSNEQYKHIGICFDHDHSTGHFRGWLCAKCNLALGLVNDDPERLLKLALYLEQHRAKQKSSAGETDAGGRSWVQTHERRPAGRRCERVHARRHAQECTQIEGRSGRSQA